LDYRSEIVIRFFATVPRGAARWELAVLVPTFLVPLVTIPAFSQNYTIQTFAGGGLPQNIQGSAANLGKVSAVVVDKVGNVFMSLPDYSVVVKLDTSGFLTLVAGNGIPSSSGDGGPATNAELVSPGGLAFDPLGNLYIADETSVREVSNGVITTVASVTASSVAFDGAGNLYIADFSGNVQKLSNGVITKVVSGARGSIALDSAGNLYIADYYNGRVREFSNGILTTVAGGGTGGDGGLAINAQLGWPSALAFDSAGNLYIADAFYRRVRKVSNGIISTVAGTGVAGYNGDNQPATSAWLNSPSGIALDGAGNLFIADTDNSRVRKVSGGTITTAAGGGSFPNFGDGGPATNAHLENPTGIAIAGSGDVYFVDSYEFRVRQVSNGVITTAAGSGSSGFGCPNGPAISANLSYPSAVAVDTIGNVYIADTQNNCIRRLSNGQVTTVAGLLNFAQGSYSGDNGPATSAGLNLPTALAVDATANLYIADSGNYRIRKVSNGVITTVVGNGTRGFSGDNGPATSAQLTNPTNVAVDSMGNMYIADGNRVRKVSNGVITTVISMPTAQALAIALSPSGDFYFADESAGRIYKFSGGQALMIAELANFGLGPIGLAVDSGGRIYASVSGRIRVLIPQQTGCAASVNPSAIQVDSYFGGSFPVTVQSDPSCFWTVVGLPDWIGFSPGSASGLTVASATVYLNPGPSRIATILVGGLPVVISQVAGPPCDFYPTPGTASGQAFSAAGGAGSFLFVTNGFGCVWSANNVPAWVTITGASSGLNQGPLTFQVAPNAGVARSATFTVANLPFTIEQQAGSIAGLGLIGSMPHIAAEENWTTTFTLVNKGASSAQARFSAFDESGNSVSLPLLFPQQPPAPSWLLAAALDRTLAGKGSLLMSTAAIPTAPVLVGTAQVGANGAVDGFAIFHLIPGAQEAVVPLETRNASSYLLAFDNTNGVVLGVAVGNAATQAANVAVVIRDDTGAQIGSGSVALPANGHKSFVLSTLFPVTGNARGTIEFDTPAGGQISVLGIRTTPLGGSTTLTTIPPLANVGTSGGSMAHLAVANGWKTTFVLVNTGATAAQAHLKFFDDQGSPLLLPLSFPQAGGGTSSVDSGVNRTLAAGATLVVDSTGELTDALLTGSAQLTTDGKVSGFVIFRYQPNGQEAVVPLENRNAGGYLLAFDNTGVTATGIAVNNASPQAVNIPVVIRDETGTQIGSDTIALAANGHSSFTLVVDKYAMTAGIRGTLEFDTPAGSQIGALGIRIPQGHTFTTLPALAK
jgi:sugar lactone lactonase YvrE